MRAEVIAIGSELLLGDLVDTNSTWISQALTQIGINCFFQTKVDDDIQHIQEAIQTALIRADVIICCGGLGPTSDDLTRDAIALVIDSPLVSDQSMEAVIAAKFAVRQRTMTANNLKQALKPQKASFLPTQPGTAPGLCCDFNQHLIFAVPGVPREMQAMLTQDIIPILMARQNQPQTVVTSTIKIWGLNESAIAEQLGDLESQLTHHPDVKLSYLASGMNGIKVRLTAKGQTAESIHLKLEPFIHHIKNIFGHYIFGFDDETMEGVVLEKLKQQHKTIAFYENATAGLLYYRLSQADHFAQVKGATCGTTTYLPTQLTAAHSYCRIEAQRVRLIWQSDIGLAVIVFPTAENHPLNAHVFFAIDTQEQQICQHMVLPFNTAQRQEFAAIYALDTLRHFLMGTSP